MNLANTRLTEHAFMGIIDAIAEAKFSNLQSVHLCGNPTIAPDNQASSQQDLVQRPNQRLSDYACQKLSIKQRKHVHKKDLVDVPAETQKGITFIFCKTVDDVLKAAASD